MKTISVLICLLGQLAASAQQDGRKLVDSLVNALPLAANDTVKARLYNKLFFELSQTSVEEAKQYAVKGLAHAQAMRWPKGIAVFQNNLGIIHTNQKHYDSAVHYYDLALQTHIGLGDQYNTANTYNSMGTAAQNIRADFSKAAEYYFKALRVAESIHDNSLQALTLSNIANIYSLQKNFPRALEYGKKALQITERTGTPDELAVAMMSLGKTHYSAGDTTAARQYFLKAQTLYESTGNIQGLATAWSAQSLVVGPDLRPVIAARLKSQALWNEVNPLHPEAITNTGNLGVAYLDLVRNAGSNTTSLPESAPRLLDKAAQHLHTAVQLASQAGDVDNQSFFTGALAELQEYRGEYKNAFYNYRTYKEMEDSIYSQDAKNKIAEAASQQAIERKNAELQISQLALRNQRITVWALVAGVVLLGIIGLLLFRQGRQRQAANAALQRLNTDLDNANKVKARFFAILSHDLRAPIASLVSFLQLKKNEPGLLTEAQVVQHEQRLTHSAEALLENMETVLLWSKDQLEQLTPRLTPISTAHLFQQLQAQFSHLPQAVLQFDGDITLLTDEDCARTILYNLTTNAVRAVATVAQPQIVWRAGERNGQPYLSITDNGTGLDPAWLQDDEQRAAAAGSVRSGLGLTIVKDLAAAIQCTLSMPAVTVGTCIELGFPAIKEASPRDWLR
ncbi:tetratricopeptide repeat-containing sensor histidine kinase [Paraflavitalea pollutisoli]|uniref:tetratricopeptide repeat-containing sensor histidine kinase n=1 Tax=Paraflavitalea pollutisoli TaxID=3034143 RepID=UPI0023ED1AEA|nr:tetratricopeptide repeat-containing sensor histidine kinase [Paraflavitalea sp. H1-2-19X]